MECKLMLRDTDIKDELLIIEAESYEEAIEQLWYMDDYWFSDSDLATMDGDCYDYITENHFCYDGKYLKWERLDQLQDKYWIVNEHNEMSEILESTYKQLWDMMENDKGLEKIIHIAMGTEQEIKKKLCIYEDMNKIYTFPEASEKWGLADGTLRNIPRSPGRLIEGVDYRKSGKVWLITEAAMRKLYGEPKIK